MLKKTITYTNADGATVSENHYFHIMGATLTEMEVSHPGGMQAYVKKLMESNDRKEIIRIFRELIDYSIGRRTESGGFEQTPEILAEFKRNSLLYDALFTEIATNDQAALEFLVGIMPEAVKSKIDVKSLAIELQPMTGSAPVPGFIGGAIPPGKEPPAWVRESRDPTYDELLTMPEDQLAAFRKKVVPGQDPRVLRTIKDNP